MFGAGAKIHQSNGRTRCIEQGGVNYTLEEGSDIPEGIASCYAHATEALRKIRELESAITNLEKQSSDDTFFPITVKRRPPQTTSSSGMTPSSPPSQQRRAKTKKTVSPSSMSTVCQTSPSVIQLPENLQVGHILQYTWMLIISMFLSLRYLPTRPLLLSQQLGV